MTKPHDEEWTTGDVALSGALYSGDAWIGSFTNPERARLAKEAPALVRAILDNGYVRKNGDGLWHTDACNDAHDGSSECWNSCGRLRAALNATGASP